MAQQHDRTRGAGELTAPLLATSLEDLVPEARLAERWDVSVRTLQRRRAAGLAPPHLKLGRAIHYTASGIARHEADHIIAPGDTP